MKKKMHKFLCVNCSYNALPLYVEKDLKQLREAGYLKKMPCFACGKTINHAEIQDGDGPYTLTEFHLEWAHGNFDNEGNRKKPWYQFIDELKEKGLYKRLKQEKGSDYFG